MGDRVQRIALLFSGSVVCLLVAVGGAALFGERCDVASASQIRPAWPTRFAIADLDGDLKPDIATLEVENERNARTNYWIRLQLSTGVRPAIAVKGPAGGLQLAARDVNGDDALDLIVSSISDPHIVTVLLNDGHGDFAAGELDDYALPTESEAFLREPDWLSADTLTLAQLRSTFDGECSAAAEVFLVPRSDWFRAREDSSAAVSAHGPIRGRSPPRW